MNKLFAVIFLSTLLIAAIWFVSHAEHSNADGVVTRHRVDHFLKLASEIQALGKDKGFERLRELANSADAKDEHDGYEVFVLCRMLFTSKADSSFRRPLLGSPVFLGDAAITNCPLEPIELVDGVPFFITRGYRLGGKPERAISYVEYCIVECDWSTAKYVPKGDREKRQALDKLLSFPKWQRPLDESERSFLESQIK